jgi:hypothetical protein
MKKQSLQHRAKRNSVGRCCDYSLALKADMK